MVVVMLAAALGEVVDGVVLPRVVGGVVVVVVVEVVLFSSGRMRMLMNKRGNA